MLRHAQATIPPFASMESMLVARRFQAIRVKGSGPDGHYTVKFTDGTVCAVYVKGGFVVQVPNVVRLGAVKDV